jgi:two-component sensor histidine kinase
VAVELLNDRKDGTPFWNGVFVSPVTNAAGEVIYYFGSLFDVTAKKERELGVHEDRSRLADLVEARDQDLRHTTEQKAVLLHEVEHRVKNNLQLVSALIQFQVRRTADAHVRAALQDVQERVSALSTVHRRLFRSVDPGRFDVAQFLRDLCDDALARSGREQIGFEFDLEPVEAPATDAAPLALLLNEILSHALRRGFPEGRAGRISVRARRAGDRLRIELSDDSALTSGETRAALGGSTGIVEVLRRQLRAEIDWSDNFPGLQVFIEMPVQEG